MTVSDLIQALAQFAPNAPVVYGDGRWWNTPHKLRRSQDGDVVILEGAMIETEERESNP